MNQIDEIGIVLRIRALQSQNFYIIKELKKRHNSRTFISRLRDKFTFTNGESYCSGVAHQYENFNENLDKILEN
jgi:hypothetical protein